MYNFKFLAIHKETFSSLDFIDVLSAIIHCAERHVKMEAYIPSMNVLYFKKLGIRLIRKKQTGRFRKLLAIKKEAEEKYSKI